MSSSSSSSSSQDVVESVPINALGIQLPTISPSTAALLTRKTSLGTPFSSAYSPMQGNSRRYSIDSFEPQSDCADTARTCEDIRSNSATIINELVPSRRCLSSSNWSIDYSTRSMAFQRSATHGSALSYQPSSTTQRHVSFADGCLNKSNDSPLSTANGDDDFTPSLDEHSDPGSEYTVAALKRDADDDSTPRDELDDDNEDNDGDGRIGLLDKESIVMDNETLLQEIYRQRSASIDKTSSTMSTPKIPTSMPSSMELTIPYPVNSIFHQQNAPTVQQQESLIGDPLAGKEEHQTFRRKLSTPFSSSPCGLNRWVILVVCLMITASTGSFFFNWPSTQSMILNGGAYEWECGQLSEEIDVLNSKPPLIVTPTSEEASEAPPAASAAVFKGVGDSTTIGSMGGPFIRTLRSGDRSEEWRRYSLVVPSGLERRLGSYLESAVMGSGLKDCTTTTTFAPFKTRGGVTAQVEREQNDGEATTGSSSKQMRTVQRRLTEGQSQQHHPHCVKQIQSINSLMPIGVASWFIFSLAGGIWSDIFGPRFTSISGIILSASGWFTLAFCSEVLPLYMLAFALIGCGVDVIFIGILNTSNLFPNYRGTIVSLFNAARSLAFGIPSVFNFMVTSTSGLISFRTACFIYGGFVLFWGIIIYVIVPSKAYPNLNSKSFIIQDEISEENEAESASKSNNSSNNCQSTNNIIKDHLADKTSITSQHHSPFYLCSQCQSKLASESSSSLTGMESMTTLPSCTHEDHPSMITSASSFSAPHATITTTSSTTAEERVCNSCACVDVILMNGESHDNELSTRHNKTTNTLMFRPHSSDTIDNPSRCIRGWTRASKTFELMKSSSFYPLVPLAIFTVLRGSFFSNSAINQIGPFVRLFTILTPLSFLPAPLFGVLADKLSIHFVFALLNTLGTFQFMLLVFAPNSLVCQGIVTVLNLFIASFFLGQFYCYVTLSFPSEFTGTLVGLVISCSGLFGLLVTPMYNYSTNTHSFTLMNSLCLSFALICFFFIFLLWRASKSNPRPLVIKGLTSSTSAAPSKQHVIDAPPHSTSLLSLEEFVTTPLHSNNMHRSSIPNHSNPLHPSLLRTGLSFH